MDFNKTKKVSTFLALIAAWSMLLSFEASGIDRYGKWDGGLPLKSTRVIEFTTDEGTDMSNDISPDGSTIAFDLLGDIYAVPIGGGEARSLTSGIAVDGIPRFSPDGKRIAFASDRSGLANVWVMNADGSGLKQITHFDNVIDPLSPRDFQRIEWSADGRALLVLPHISSTNRVPAHFLRVDLVSGKISDLTTGIADKSAIRYGIGGGSEQGGSKLWLGDIGQLHRLTPATGQVETFKLTASGAKTADFFISPTVSRDGRWLVYRAEFAEELSALSSFLKTELRLHDLRTGGLENDAVITDESNQPGSARAGRAPSRPLFSFTPDSKSVVYSSFGKLKRLDLESRKISVIPFTAQVRAELGPLVRNPQIEFDTPVKVRQLRSVNGNTDGERIVFNALGKIWMQQGGGKPNRLTAGSAREYDPVLSPDGQWVAYTTWSYAGGSALWKVRVFGGDKQPPVKLAESLNPLMTPRWSPDGAHITALKVTPTLHSVGVLTSNRLTLVRVPAEGGAAVDLATFQDPMAFIHYIPLLTFSSDGGRVYFVEYEGGGKQVLCSIAVSGTDKRRHARLKGQPNDMMTASPDGKWLTVQSRYNMHFMPMPQGGTDQEAALVDFTGVVPVPSAHRLSTDGGAQPIWSTDGKRLWWSWGNRAFSVSSAELASGGPLKPRVATADLSVPRGGAKGHVLLSNAKVIAMPAAGSPGANLYRGQPMQTNPGVIERGDILLEGNRIKAVGPSGSLAIPRGTTVVDLAGKTVVPGYLAVHEHNNGGGLFAEQSSMYASYLANGFTTVHSPGSVLFSIYIDDMVAAGEVVGPRWLESLVHVMTSIEKIPDYATAEAIARKHKSGGFYVLKEYENDHRVQRQWLAMAAAKHGLRTECHPFMSNVFDGCSEVAHVLAGEPQADMDSLASKAGTTSEMKDVLRGRFLKRYGVYYFKEGKRQWYPLIAQNSLLKSGKEDVVPPSTPDALSLRQRLVLNRQRDAVRRGWARAIGTDAAHGNLVAHFQTWDQVHPEGLTNAEALRVLTINGARTLGLEKDLGSIEPGKIADLVILNGDPLKNIRNTIEIRYIVKSGEVYDRDTLDVVWPVARKFQMFPWAYGAAPPLGTYPWWSPEGAQDTRK